MTSINASVMAVVESTWQRLGFRRDKMFVPTPNVRNPQMLQEAEAFSEQLAAFETAVREYHKHAQGFLRSLVPLMECNLPRVWTLVEGGLSEPVRPAISHGHPTRIGGDYNAGLLLDQLDLLQRGINEDVLAPLRRWQEGLAVARERLSALDRMRVEVDSQRRKAEKKFRNAEVKIRRAYLGAGYGSSSSSDEAEDDVVPRGRLLEDYQRLALHTERQLNAISSSYADQERLVWEQLSGLVTDAAWLESYAAATMIKVKEALQGAALALGPTKQPLPAYRGSGYSLTGSAARYGEVGDNMAVITQMSPRALELARGAVPRGAAVLPYQPLRAKRGLATPLLVAAAASPGAAQRQLALQPVPPVALGASGVPLDAVPDRIRDTAIRDVERTVAGEGTRVADAPALPPVLEPSTFSPTSAAEHAPVRAPGAAAAAAAAPSTSTTKTTTTTAAPAALRYTTAAPPPLQTTPQQLQQLQQQQPRQQQQQQQQRNGDLQGFGSDVLMQPPTGGARPPPAPLAARTAAGTAAEDQVTSDGTGFGVGGRSGGVGGGTAPTTSTTTSRGVAGAGMYDTTPSSSLDQQRLQQLQQPAKVTRIAEETDTNALPSRATRGSDMMAENAPVGASSVGGLGGGNGGGGLLEQQQQQKEQFADSFIGGGGGGGGYAGSNNYHNGGAAVVGRGLGESSEAAGYYDSSGGLAAPLHIPAAAAAAAPAEASLKPHLPASSPLSAAAGVGGGDGGGGGGSELVTGGDTQGLGLSTPAAAAVGAAGAAGHGVSDVTDSGGYDTTARSDDVLDSFCSPVKEEAAVTAVTTTGGLAGAGGAAAGIADEIGKGPVLRARTEGARPSSTGGYSSSQSSPGRGLAAAIRAELLGSAGTSGGGGVSAGSVSGGAADSLIGTGTGTGAGAAGDAPAAAAAGGDGGLARVNSYKLTGPLDDGGTVSSSEASGDGESEQEEFRDAVSQQGGGGSSASSNISSQDFDVPMLTGTAAAGGAGEAVSPLTVGPAEAPYSPSAFVAAASAPARKQQPYDQTLLSVQQQH